MGKHDATLRSLFDEPTRANIKWPDVEALLAYLGADISEGSGSRVRVALNDVRAVFHRPHPEKEISRPGVRSVQRFLREAGIEP